MSVIPMSLACWYISPSTSVDTALLHSNGKSEHIRRMLAYTKMDKRTIENGELWFMIEDSSEAHLFDRNRMRVRSRESRVRGK